MNIKTAHPSFISIEFQLMLLLLKSSLVKEEVEVVKKFIEEKQIDWGEFEKKVLCHKITMPVFRGLNTLPSYLINQEIYANYKERVTIILFKNLSLSKEVLLLSNIFEEEKIDVVFYKGSALSYQLFEALNSRSFGDIDFLTRKEDLKKIEEVLLKRNYTPEYTLSDKETLDGYLQEEPEYNFDLYENGRRKYHVEPHHAFIYPFYVIDLSFEEIKKHIVKVDINGKKLNTFDINFVPIILSIHHGGKDGWSILKHIYDWYALMKKYDQEIDWQAVQNTAIKFDIEVYLYVSLAILEKLMDIAPPPLLKAAIQNNKNQKIATRIIRKIHSNDTGKKTESGYAKLWFRFKTSRKLSTKRKMIGRIFSILWTKIISQFKRS